MLPSWCAPRRADGIEVIGAAAGLAMAGAGHRPVAAALGVPAATARGWLRRLRANARQLRAHAIGELNGLGFYPPGPPSEPAGSPLGDALNADRIAGRLTGQAIARLRVLVGTSDADDDDPDLRGRSSWHPGRSAWHRCSPRSTS